MDLKREMFSTPHSRPVEFWFRPWTSDWNTCNAISGQHDEYHLPTGLTGLALDVGAHIGVCAVNLLVDNPGLCVVAIEALPENVELIRANLALNGVEDRCIVLAGAATDDRTIQVSIGYGNVADPTGIHEYIGNADAPPTSRFAVVRGISLADVFALPGVPDRIVWAKLDCEGCELPFLSSPLLDRIDHIEGEVHPSAGGVRFRDLLTPTHDVTFPGWDANPDFGPFTATIR
jgi:FkbM family methyltransferase